MKGKLWTDAERDELRRRYPTQTSAEIAKALGRPYTSVCSEVFKLGLKKDRLVVAAIARDRSSNPNHGGNRTRFKKGNIPFSKGTKGVHGNHPNTRGTQFKVGSKPTRTLPVGAYRVTHGNTLERKLTDEPGPPSKRWFAVHRTLWESANGPIPPGHVVAFKTGTKSIELEQIRLENLELISHAENMHRNSHHANYPPEVSKLIQLRGALTRQINKRADNEQEHQ